MLPGYDRAEGPGPRLRDAPGPRGERLRLAEREVVLPDSPAPLLVQVAVARGAMDGEVRRLRLLLAVAFGVLGIGLVAGVAGQVVWGLRPLRRARDALAEVRAGNRARLAAVAMPSEIAPLLEEIDALIEQNRATVERARAHVGNLAHALKTPIAIQRGALDTAPPDLPTALAQNRAMERLVQHHLTRARAAAMAGAAAAESVPHAVGEELARVLRRLFQDRGISITVEGDRRVRVRVDQQDLTEMLGNLMENACKWAGSTVTLEVAREAAEVVVAIADDGPGLTGQQRAMALARGVRLDEAAPGSGLGLAIVADLAALYGGSLTLEPASLSGLRAVLRLPGR
ncbi:sensor histidine kinase [Paeniroseomonas aquatica]|uniref:sensor histidine kinase n=1 Tax=Paeniroseomonas aquatica TaxID=373043 RepID=UPI00360C08B6